MSFKFGSLSVQIKSRSGGAKQYQTPLARIARYVSEADDGKVNDQCRATLYNTDLPNGQSTYVQILGGEGCEGWIGFIPRVDLPLEYTDNGNLSSARHGSDVYKATAQNGTRPVHAVSLTHPIVQDCMIEGGESRVVPLVQTTAEEALSEDLLESLGIDPDWTVWMCDARTFFNMEDSDEAEREAFRQSGEPING